MRELIRYSKRFMLENPEGPQEALQVSISPTFDYWSSRNTFFPSHLVEIEEKGVTAKLQLFCCQKIIRVLDLIEITRLEAIKLIFEIENAILSLKFILKKTS